MKYSMISAIVAALSATSPVWANEFAKHCSVGKPCGNTCIAVWKTCNIGGGGGGIPPVTIPTPTIPPNATPVSFAHINDGDTLALWLNNEKLRVRLSGVDAPETDQSWGNEARACLASIIASQNLGLVREGTDKYGRTLGTVYAGFTNVNLELLKRGCAWMYRQTTSDSNYDAAEQSARASRQGLWAQTIVQSPWEFRRAGYRSKASVVFDWAQRKYPTFFDGTPTISTPAAGQEIWYWPVTNTTLSTTDGRVYGQGSLLAWPVAVDIGALSDYFNTANMESD